MLETARVGPPVKRLIVSSVPILLVSALAWRTVTDLDAALHLASGRWIWEHGWVPDRDPFTYTVSDHRYVAYHWLFQLVAHAIHSAFGGAGLTALRWLVVLATSLLVLDTLRIRRVSALAGASVGLAAILTVEFRFLLRPELASLLLAAATLWILERHRAGRSGLLWLLPCIQVLWVNTHVFVLGWAIMLAYAGPEAIRRRAWSLPVVKWVGLALAAALLNPYHLRAVLYPLYLATRLDGGNLFAQEIIELASPLEIVLRGDHPFSRGPQLKAYALLLALGSVGAVVHLRRRRWSDALLLVAFGSLSLLAVRNIGLCAVVCAPSLATVLDDVGGTVAARWSPALRRSVTAALLGVVLLGTLVTTARVVRGAYYLEGVRLERFAAGICDDCLGVSAADWLAESGLAGRGFNNLNMGSTLIWRDPGRKVFIDARNEVSGREFLEEYLAVFEPGGWSEAVHRYGFEYAVLRYGGEDTALRLARQLDRNPAWRLAYVDGSAAIFVRVDGPNASLPAAAMPPPVSPAERRQVLETLRLESGAGARLRRWLWSDAETPGARFELGTLLLVLGRLGRAEAPLLQAAVASPDSFETHNNLGELYWRRKMGAPALRAYRNALAIDPSHPTVGRRVSQLESRVR